MGGGGRGGGRLGLISPIRNVGCSSRVEASESSHDGITIEDKSRNISVLKQAEYQWETTPAAHPFGVFW